MGIYVVAVDSQFRQILSNEEYTVLRKLETSQSLAAAARQQIIISDNEGSKMA